MNWTVLKAIFRRDFVSYFSNPTGYVFICVFVMLSALAAFWPPDFFSNNLANLDQLNQWLPFILLVFIPAITMSIWAEERRQHTDELLLTLPASDMDVVLGKYLASVAIYTVALLFSMFSIYLVFMYGLGSPDVGLFVGTYVGYWFVGLAMLSIGMVASFLTSNLTVGFILGMIFNAPLAMFGVADWIIKNPAVGAGDQAMECGRAVPRLRAGRDQPERHQLLRDDRGRDAVHQHGAHRPAALGRPRRRRVDVGCITRPARSGLWRLAIGLNLFLSHHNLLVGGRHEREAQQAFAANGASWFKKLRDDKDVKTIKIDAYVSPQVPAEYAAHKLNLLSTLSELSSLSGGKIQVDVHEIENFSEEASNAEKAYGIEPREVVDDRSRRAQEGRNLSGRRVHVRVGPRGDSVHRQGHSGRIRAGAFDLHGRPAEAEEARRAEDRRAAVRRLLDAGARREESQLVDELKKQYDVVEVDAVEADQGPVRRAAGGAAVVACRRKRWTNFVAAVKSGSADGDF